MAGGKKAKATKKFEKNHLKGTIERRKEFAKIKQRHQLKAKKKERAAKNAEVSDDESSKAPSKPRTGLQAEDVNADEYFAGGLDILDKPQKKSKKAAPQTGKRKRDSESPVTSEPGPAGLDDEDGNSAASDEDSVDLDKHKDQISALAEKDPEFYKYLQENDSELLDFDVDDDLAAVDDLSASEDERPTKKAKNAKKEKEEVEPDAGGIKVTGEMVKKWKKAMAEQHSIRATRQIVLAFRAAAHVNDEDEKDFRFAITSPEIYHEILSTALKEVPTVLQHHLPVKESGSGKIRISNDSAKFKTLSPLIKSYASSIHHLVGSLSDAATLRLTITSFEPLMPYLLQFRKFLKVIVKNLVGIWADGSNNEVTRISAFLVIRRLMVIGDPGLRETILKSVYEGVVKGSRNTTMHTLPGINLMKNSAAEIWGIDQKVGYTTGFNFIRQLAIHLRTNVTKPTKDSYKTIYNWQYIHSLDFWSRVLSTHCNSLHEAQSGAPSQLRPLIYPCVQITLGVMRLIPTATYFPLRFHLIRSLLRISQSTDTYIPLASPLLEVLNTPDLKRAPKPSTLKPLDFTHNYRAPTTYLRTRVYQDGISDQLLELISEFFVLHTKSIAFPELELPVTVMLKRWIRSATSKTTGNKNTKLNQGVMLLVQKLESNAKWIQDRRNKVTFSPRDREEVNAFLKEVKWEDTPLGAFVMGQRKVREDKRRVEEEGRKEDERRKKKAKSGDDDDGDVDMGAGEFDSEDEAEEELESEIEIEEEDELEDED